MKEIAILRWIYRKLANRLSKLGKAVSYEPWMFYEEMELIEELLKKTQPRKCLEWGTGGSTLYFNRFLDKSSSWLSVEHNQEWAAKIMQELGSSSQIKIVHVKVNHSSWTDKDGDGQYADLKDYIEYPRSFGSFDFILVDGRARKDCLVMAHQLLAPNGIVVLHDAERLYYHEPLRLFKYQAMFSNYRRGEKSIWIASKDRDIKGLINVREYEQLWSRYNFVRKLIKK